MKNQATHQSLLDFEDRVACVVTELNGLRSRIVNQEATAADFNDDLIHLFDQLRRVEGAVSELADLFLR
ncbi:MAG: hypothetical protein AB1801_08325 [Chloroflexota bacterium]